MNFDLAFILKTVPGVLIGLVIHELAHAYTAYRLGDTTSRDQGRLTLNPLKHLDPIGFLLIVIAGFGWAKPVEVDPSQLKHKHRDEILISLAGPASNLVLAVVFVVVARFLYQVPYFHMTDLGLGAVNQLVLWAALNLGLFFFNLIPIPPLDGSHLYTTFLKVKNPQLFAAFYRYGTLVLLIVVLFQNFTKITILPLSPLICAMLGGLLTLFGSGS